MDDNLFEDQDDKAIVPVETRLQKARDHIAAGEMDEATPIIVSILREDKQNVPALWMYANLKKSGDKDKAIAALRTLLKVQPEHEKAKVLLAKLDPEDDDLFELDVASKPQKQARSSEGINITVTPNITVQGAQQQMVGGMPMMPMEDVNQAALWIGFLVALFTGIWGLSYLINGKIMGAIGYFFVGIGWAILAAVLVVASAGVCALGVLPLHIYLAWSHSKRGATKLVAANVYGGMRIG